MSNTNGPYGFRQVGRVASVASNFGNIVGKMAYNAAACYFGDVLTISSGKVAAAAVTGGGAEIAGIAISFSWNSTAQQKRVRQLWYPGSDSVGNADVDVYMDADGGGLYQCQCTTGPILQASVGSYANFGIGSGGNQRSGISSYSLNDGTISSTKGSLPFRIIGLIQPPVSDPTAAYNQVLVQPVNINTGV